MTLYSDATDPKMFRAAVISDDQVYRYELYRRWAFDGETLLWIMLNPSTADHLVNDPTITRVINFSRAWGYGAALVCNLFAFRATDPRELGKAADPVGPDNDATLRNAARRMPTVVAWGAEPHAAKRVAAVAALLTKPRCLGITKGGHPKHPLYVAAATPLTAWEPA